VFGARACALSPLTHSERVGRGRWPRGVGEAYAARNPHSAHRPFPARSRGRFAGPGAPVNGGDAPSRNAGGIIWRSRRASPRTMPR
jgi:hypothetical protein